MSEFIAVKFNPWDRRTYTYTCDFRVEEGDPVVVMTRDGEKVVTVVAVDIPEPPFECKAALRIATADDLEDPEDADAF